jgi:hypothetical protein
VLALKSVGDCHANAELRRDRESELYYKGNSHLQISRMVGVSPQTVSNDMKVIREQTSQIREELRLHTYEDSFAMWRQLLAKLWNEYDETKNHQIQLRIIDRIIEVQREIDHLFLPDT